MNEAPWTKEELASAIELATIEKWDAGRYPLLLSELGMELTKQRGDFRPIIAPLKLRQFIATQLSSKVVVVTHPKQLQKIALIPAGKQFSFIEDDESIAPLIEESERIKPSLWAAFVKPLPDAADRYVDTEDKSLRFQDVPKGSSRPFASSRQVPVDLIINGRGPGYDAREVALTIKKWAVENGVPDDALFNREPRKVASGPSIFQVFKGLSDVDLRRIDIPFDIIMKLISK